MASNKIKFPLWLTPECKQVVEDNYRPDQCQSRSEFIEKQSGFTRASCTRWMQAHIFRVP